ncbi:unnamed protein product [Owenia fusiformis]|uniref:Peptidase M20 domain-containing protein 2 n=1 Tax=Owenia fusiformis TaxID=6347 RepID=A0A8S4Q1C2_OWEFU|nr:unnamed protein product [Owenia fusiformis]
MSLEDLKKIACEAIDKAAKELNTLSQEIWKNPELNFEEHHAHKVLTEYLTKTGFNVEPKYKLDTAFRAIHGSDGEGPHVAVLCEYDALPEIGHACGHNLLAIHGSDGEGPHVAVLCEYDALPVIGHACGHNLIAEVGIAAGIGIKAAMEASGKNIGKLTVLGTPAEEGGGGKVDLIKAEVFKDFDIAMMCHPCPFTYKTLPGLLAVTFIQANFHGKASHAAGFPWEGKNALDAAVMAYQSISCMRQQFKPSWRVHGIITKGGVKPNIIPDETELLYYLRAPTDKEVAEIKAKTIDIFESAAKMTGCTVDITYPGKPYSNLITNDTLATTFEENAKSIGVEFEADAEKATAGGSTDMGNVSYVVPSIHPVFYIGTDAPNHSIGFTAAAGDAKAQPYTLDQGKALAMTALDVFLTPGVLEQARKDFQKDTA